MKSSANKLLVLMAIVVVFATLNLFVRHTSLANRGIVVALGIDYLSDEKKYEITAQLALSSGTSSEGAGQNDYVTVVGQGETLPLCFDSIARQSGTTQGFRHCSIIIVGRELVENMKCNYVSNYFFVESNIPDNVLMAMSNDTAKSIVTSEAALTSVSAYHIRRILNPMNSNAGVQKTTVKNYMANTLKLKENNVLPIVDMTQSPSVMISQEPEPPQTLYAIERAVYLDNTHSVDLTKQQSFGLTCVTEKLTGGTVGISVNEDVSISFWIIKSTPDVKLEMEPLTADISIKLRVRLLALRHKDDVLNSSTDLNEEEKNALKQDVVSAIEACITVMKETNSDLFDIYNAMYSEYGEKWQKSAPDDYLQQLSTSVNVEIVYD